MTVFWVMVHVGFRNPMTVTNENNATEPERLLGFFQTYGCTAADEEQMKNTICDHWQSDELKGCADGDPEFEKIDVLTPTELQRIVYDDPVISKHLLGDPASQGIWYKSGRALYTDSDDNTCD